MITATRVKCVHRVIDLETFLAEILGFRELFQKQSGQSGATKFGNLLPNLDTLEELILLLCNV